MSVIPRLGRIAQVCPAPVDPYSLEVEARSPFMQTDTVIVGMSLDPSIQETDS